MCQKPVRELEALRGEKREVPAATVKDVLPVEVRGQQLEIVAEFEPGTATEFGFRVLKGDGQQTVVGYNTAAAEMFVDRRESGIVDFHPAFAGRHAGPLGTQNGRVRLRLLVDRSSVEVFGNHGETVITDLVFPDAASDRVEVFATGGECRLVSCEIWPLKSAWTK
jgi:fructan beta-fructosidase